MKDETVNKIEDNLRKAQELIEETAKLLCNEPGDSTGGRIWSYLTIKAEEIVVPLNYTYDLRDWE